MSILGNHIYMVVATKMAGDCGVELAHWTRRLGGVCIPEKVGNIIETYTTFFIRHESWDEMWSLLRYLAFQDEYGLDAIVAGHSEGCISGQAPLPPPPDDPTSVGTSSKVRRALPHRRSLAFRPAAPDGDHLCLVDSPPVRLLGVGGLSRLRRRSRFPRGSPRRRPT